mmetsp:Transcript_35240/g.83992  ORF Transcript_35240/g.83992 Transcript_35240/m.83992 type:complete len:87 (-) Transcript_35240:179-439(-)
MGQQQSCAWHQGTVDSLEPVEEGHAIWFQCMGFGSVCVSEGLTAEAQRSSERIGSSAVRHALFQEPLELRALIKPFKTCWELPFHR